ncbi:substrate-binding periplasmic protein [Rickettsiales bacterium LUAb2]
MLGVILKSILIILIILDVFFLVKSLLNKDIKSIVSYVVILLVLLVLLSLPKLLMPKEEAKNLNQTNNKVTTLRVATEGAYFPWNYVSASGNPEGFDVDIAKEIAKRLNIQAKFEVTPWESIIPNLMNNQVDLVVSSLSITESRKQNINFSIPYAQVLAGFFGLNSNFAKYKDADINTLKKVLKGKTIGAQSGTTLPLYLQQEFKGIVTIKYYANQSQLMMEVNSGRIDAGFSEIVSAVKFVNENPKMTFFGPKLGIKDSPVFGEGIAIGVNKDNSQLLNQVNKVLADMHKDGTIKALSLKYFGTDISYMGNNK